MSGVRQVSARCPRAVRGVDTLAPAPPHPHAEFGGLRASTPAPLRVPGVEALDLFGGGVGGAGMGSVVQELVMVERRSWR
jgi:hypothetical protein